MSKPTLAVADDPHVAWESVAEWMMEASERIQVFEYVAREQAKKDKRWAEIGKQLKSMNDPVNKALAALHQINPEALVPEEHAARTLLTLARMLLGTAELDGLVQHVLAALDRHDISWEDFEQAMEKAGKWIKRNGKWYHKRVPPNNPDQPIIEAPVVKYDQKAERDRFTKFLQTVNFGKAGGLGHIQWEPDGCWIFTHNVARTTYHSEREYELWRDDVYKALRNVYNAAMWGPCFDKQESGVQDKSGIWLEFTPAGRKVFAA